MEDFPTQKITIYHKSDNVWNRYVVEASYRNTSISNHNKSGSSSTDNALVRIFDIDEYNSKWFVQKNTDGRHVRGKSAGDPRWGTTYV